MNYEKQICGLIMYEPARYTVCIDAGICADSFKDVEYKRIWSAISEVCQEDGATTEKIIENVSIKCIDIVGTVAGTLDVIHNLLSIDAAVRGLLLDQKRNKICSAIERGMSVIRQTVDESEMDQAASSLKESLESHVDVAVDRFSSREYSEVLESVEAIIEQKIVDRRAGKSLHISTGYKLLDVSINGFSEGGLYILAARTGMGKTTLAINFAEHVLAQGHGVLFFSNEMSAEQIAIKHLSLVSGVRSYLMENGLCLDSDLDKIHQATKARHKSKFIINEFAGTQFEKFKIQLRHAVRKHNVKVVFHDYIQQMFSEESSKQNRVQELSKISSEIKSLARELKISIVCLAQLNRQAEFSATNGDLPSIAQIKDSGAMEQDADVVMIIHRKRDSEDDGTEIIVAKNRFNFVTGGDNGHVIFKSNLSINKFYEEV